ncbi:hypothetical protein Pan44_35580 [Caulifigura coniformis]|uniref:Uncharacterized protein n=1 Tax=Caulifigura coniformis TaxID=2527983 RepID=A0A517SHA8_9PLAN|nr:hypothetical protein [Caulifigura coniformis]QDT55514.1 hypothetical protein Pan44_35580 [Caulifigura coniformis]
MQREFRDFLTRTVPGQSSPYLFFRMFCRQTNFTPDRRNEMAFERLLETEGLIEDGLVTRGAGAARMKWPIVTRNEVDE